MLDDSRRKAVAAVGYLSHRASQPLGRASGLCGYPDKAGMKPSSNFVGIGLPFTGLKSGGIGLREPITRRPIGPPTAPIIHDHPGTYPGHDRDTAH